MLKYTYTYTQHTHTHTHKDTYYNNVCTQSAVDTITLAFQPSGPHQYSAHVHIYVCVRVCDIQVHTAQKYIYIHYNTSTYTTAQLTLDTHLCTEISPGSGAHSMGTCGCSMPHKCTMCQQQHFEMRILS